MYTFSAPGSKGGRPAGGGAGTAGDSDGRLQVEAEATGVGKAAPALPTMPPPVLTSVAPRTGPAKRPRTTWL